MIGKSSTVGAGRWPFLFLGTFLFLSLVDIQQRLSFSLNAHQLLASTLREVHSEVAEPTSANNGQCINLEVDGKMDEVISEARQIVVTMPAKAAGSSMKQFTSECMKVALPDNFANREQRSLSSLTQSLKLPVLTASHTYSSSTLVALMQNSPRNSVLIYLHRDETDRLQSGIKMVVRNRVCTTRKVGIPKKYLDDMYAFHKGTECVLNELPLVKLIKDRILEIGMGAPENLACDTYKAIEDNAADMYFIHYRQANKLQKLLAKHHCPELMNTSVAANIDEGREDNVFIRLGNSNSNVTLDTWVKEKSAKIEWLLRLKQKASCQGKTRHMEDDLFSCPDEAIKADDLRVRRW